MWMIVGLGNPGAEYDKTRHNTGWMVLDALAGDAVWVPDTKKGALTVKDKNAVLVKPTTFMNKSGTAVAAFLRYYKIKPESVVVVHDDIDMALGTMKIVFGRGSGGHRGVESVARALKTKDFVRIKVGVLPTTSGGKLKKPHGEDAVARFIMGRFSKTEAPAFKKIVKKAVGALDTLVHEGKVAAMNEHN